MQKAYSYIRFSTPDQIKGDSLRRQLEASKNYADRHNLHLDTSMRDEGLSAYKGTHKTKGALKKFLSLVEAGEIESGSVLIVESLDRLSREEVADALAQFLSLLSAGIEIVTLADDRRYTKSSINDVGNIVISLVEMARAHSESDIKSKRIASLWEQKRQAAMSGKAATAIGPNWLRFNAEKRQFEIIPERTEVIREIFEKTASGLGRYRIANDLNARGVEGWGKSQGWHESYIQKVLKNRAVLGEFQPHTGRGQNRKPACDPISDYYPAVIDEELFYRAEAERQKRTNKGGRRGKLFSNLFHGLGFCLACGASLRFLDKGGQHDNSSRYLVCSSAIRKHNKCTNTKYIRYDDLENIMLIEAAENIDWYSIVAGTQSELQALERTRTTLTGKLDEIKQRASRHALFMEQADDSVIQIAMQRYANALAEQSKVELELHDIEEQISLNQSTSTETISSKLAGAIAKLHSEHSEQERYEMRASINAALRDNMRIYVGMVDDQQAIGYRLKNGKTHTIAVGQEMISLLASKSAIERAELAQEGFTSMIEIESGKVARIESEMQKLGWKDA